MAEAPSSPITSRTEVLIAGAGPVGLTAAVALNHFGVKCRIVDKAPLPSDKSKALVVWCRTLELLDPLGLAETFVQTGLKATGGNIFANGKRVIHLDLQTDESQYGFPLMIPQSETERLLTEHLSRQGIVVERPVELLGFTESEHGVLSHLRHADGREEMVESAWLVGGDGAHSTVRHTLGLEFAGHAEPSDWILADVHLTGPLAPMEVSVFWHQKGVLACFPIVGDRFRIVADTGLSSEHGAPPTPTLADVQAVVDERGPAGIQLSDPIWLANFRINERKVADYRRGLVLLAGDAAHIHSPAGGQGMNTGMQDSFNLAWKLAFIQQGKGLAEPLLQSYSLERSGVGDQVLQNAERFTHLATLQGSAQQWIRNHVAPIVGSFTFVRDAIRNQWSELAIHYRHSPLSAQKWSLLTGGLHAGDRLCDGPVLSPTGEPTRLFAALGNATRHALLLLPATDDPDEVKSLVLIAARVEAEFPGTCAAHLLLKAASEAPPEMPAWVDSTGVIHQKLAATSPTLILVRPDGYIGFRAQPADGAALLEHLATYLVRQEA
jgi:2-polyprenyl-6-methoxyphenol hydroxylase-like FAD-dependent oxidoreductase